MMNPSNPRRGNPDERITLSLKPVLDAGGTTKKMHPSQPLEELPSGVDRAVLEELRLAVRTFDYLRQFGEPIEFWEAVRLARSRRGISEDFAEDGEGPEDQGLAEELQVIRRQLSPMVRDLRNFLTRVPDIPPAGEPLEVALGFLLASSKEHKAVARWLAESDEHLEKAASKLRSLSTIAAPYLDVLRPWSLDGKPPELPSPGGKEAAAAPEPVFSGPLDPEVVENLRRAVWCRRLFAEAQLDAAFWEVLMLSSVERVPMQARQARIAQAKKDNQLVAYHEETRNLHSRILPIRTRHGRWVDVLQGWLRSIPGVPQDEGEFELAVAFAVTEPDGQAKARQWLEAPEARAREAAAHLTGLAAKAKAYVAALKKPAS